MGGCLSVNVAGIIMNNILDKAFEMTGIKPIICIKYVDYLFFVIEENKIEPLLNSINIIHPKFKFKLELENDK